MKKMTLKAFSVVILSTWFVIGFGIYLCAQEGQEDSFTLEEITVTAQKREENQQKVPIVMEVVSGENIGELGYNNLDEILSTLSGVIINTSADGFRVSIRGISDDVGTKGSTGDFTMSTPSVAVNVDGVYSQGRNSGAGLYDIERVEVLYGPQSTLYSSASPGGIVNIVTADPKLDDYKASGSLKYGNYDTLQTQGMMNVPVSDNVALRASFNTSIHDGYLANGSLDEDIKSARLKTLFKFNDQITFVLTGEISKTGGHGFSSIDGFVSQDDLDDPWDNSGDDTPAPRYSDQKKISGNLNWDLAFGTISVVPSYRTEDAAATFEMSVMGGATVMNHMDRDITEKGVELRMASSSDSFIDWVVGGNYYRLNTQQNEVYEGIPTPQQLRKLDETTNAVYGNITIPVADTFRVTGGLRYSEDTNDVWEISYHEEREVTGEPWDIMHCQIPYKATDYKLGVEFDVAPESLLYADISTGFRPVGDPIQSKLKPEEITAYTIGTKNRFFDNRFQLNMAAYFYDYTNYLATFGYVPDPDNFFRGDEGAYTNADLEYYGIDLQTSAIITLNDRLDFSVSYLKSEFTRLYFDFENPKFEDQEFTGKEETFTPEWTFNIKYIHNFNLPNGGVLTPSIDFRYQTDYLVSFVDIYQDIIGGFGPGMVPLYTFSSRADYITEEAHHMSNFSMVYSHPDNKWTLTGYINNIENYAEKRSMMMDEIIIGSPRTYGAVFSVNY